jgi:O-Antigen ligase
MSLASPMQIYPDWARKVSAETIGHFFVAMIFLTSFYVKFEPAVCDLMFFTAVVFFFRSGLLLSPTLAPLFLCLLVYNVAGLVSYILVADDIFASWQFVLTSFYMSMAGFFFAAYVAADPEVRFQFILKYYFIGATIASTLGIMGYFHLASFADQFMTIGRMVSGFKDPNVFSTYLILPAVAMLQGIMLGKVRATLLNITSLFIILIALFLAFSRGAWINFSMACVAMIILSLLNSVDHRQRSGIMIKAIIVVAIMAVILVALLSMKETQFLFFDRLTLVKDYDAGEMGRFGNQRNAVPMLMVRPFGFGPLQFAMYFREAPHNTFLNAFSSFGWIGGVTFLTMVVLNLIIGTRLAFTRSPFQASAIAVFCCLVSMTFQGVQIDTEHWRHFYWMLGILWGFFAASQAHGITGFSDRDVLAGWRGHAR